MGDASFVQKLVENDAASEAALEILEVAIDQADTTSKSAAKLLNPPAAPVAPFHRSLPNRLAVTRIPLPTEPQRARKYMERLISFCLEQAWPRRAAERLIIDGKVKVNGQVITTLGRQVDGNKDLVVVSGQPVTASSQRKYFLFYKPPGVVTTLADPGRPASTYAEAIGSRVFPVGRLDFDAEGALLLTDDGELANKLMHPSHQVPRVYSPNRRASPTRLRSTNSSRACAWKTAWPTRPRHGASEGRAQHLAEAGRH